MTETPNEERMRTHHPTSWFAVLMAAVLLTAMPARAGLLALLVAVSFFALFSISALIL